LLDTVAGWCDRPEVGSGCNSDHEKSSVYLPRIASECANHVVSMTIRCDQVYLDARHNVR
jgi:hypothetical protein